MRKLVNEAEKHRLDIINVKLKMYDLYPKVRVWCSDSNKGARRPFRMKLPEGRLFYFDTIERLETYFGKFMHEHENERANG
jgi:hypothetical protein